MASRFLMNKSKMVLISRYIQSQPKANRFTILCNNNKHRNIFTTPCKNNKHGVDGASELPWQRSFYKYVLPIQTRWSDNDQYGHVNNIIYYSYFDSIINHFLIHQCGLNTNIRTSDVIGYMVDTKCTFREPISFPEVILAGLTVTNIGRSSVQYAVAIFAQEQMTERKQDHFNTKHQDTACAIGQCTHVFVDTKTNRPIKLPDGMRETLETVSIRPNSKL